MFILSQQRDDSDAAEREIACDLIAAGEGCDEAWRRLLDRYARRVFALLKSRCCDPDVAEELTQSVFVTVASKLCVGEYDEQGKFEAWLFRIAMNRLRDEMRRKKRRQSVELRDDHAAGVTTQDEQLGQSAGADPDGLEQMRRALHQLEDSDREVIELRHHAGMGFREMSDLLGEPMGTLLARHHRALKKLRVLIEGEGADEK